MIEKSAELKELFAALAKAQGDFGIAKFDSKNPHFKNEFASLTSIKSATQESLAKYGLSLIQLPTSDETGHYLTTIISHSSGQWISGRFKLLLDKPTMQGFGSAVTYARRYSKGAALDVVTDKDDDGEASVENHHSGGAVSRPTSNAKVLAEKSAPESAPPDDGIPYPASPPQIKKMFAMAHTIGWDDDALKHFLKDKFGVDSSKQIDKYMMQKVFFELDPAKHGG